MSALGTKGSAVSLNLALQMVFELDYISTYDGLQFLTGIVRFSEAYCRLVE